MSISENIKTTDDKIERNKAQYDLGRQSAKIYVFRYMIFRCVFKMYVLRFNFIFV